MQYLPASASADVCAISNATAYYFDETLSCSVRMRARVRVCVCVCAEHSALCVYVCASGDGCIREGVRV